MPPSGATCSAPFLRSSCARSWMSGAGWRACGPRGAMCCATSIGSRTWRSARTAGDDPAHARDRPHRPAVQGRSHCPAAQRPRRQRSLISPPRTIPCDANNRVRRRKLLAYNDFCKAGVQVQQEIGVPLFTRHGRGMQLTEAGAALLARIEGPLRQLERAAADVRALSGIISGHVLVGMTPTAATALGGDLVRQMADEYPDVALRIVEAYDGYLMNLVQSGDIDAALLYGPAVGLHLCVRPLFTEELRLVFRPGFLAEPSLTLAEAARHPLILPSPTHG